MTTRYFEELYLNSLCDSCVASGFNSLVELSPIWWQRARRTFQSRYLMFKGLGWATSTHHHATPKRIQRLGAPKKNNSYQNERPCNGRPLYTLSFVVVISSRSFSASYYSSSRYHSLNRFSYTPLAAEEGCCAQMFTPERAHSVTSGDSRTTTTKTTGWVEALRGDVAEWIG